MAARVGFTCGLKQLTCGGLAVQESYKCKPLVSGPGGLTVWGLGCRI